MAMTTSTVLVIGRLPGLARRKSAVQARRDADEA
jgi:hypothetical protein